MKEILTAALVSLVVSVVVLFSLGPTMIKLNAPAAAAPALAKVAPTAKPAADPASEAAVPAQDATAPNVEGMRIQQAREAWRAQHILIIEDGNRVDASVQPGTILEQNPSPGAPLKQKEIRAIVARAPEMAGVPNVVGEAVDKARAQLVAAGFEVPPAERERAEAKGGTVLRQEPNAGASTEKGSVVRLVVAADLVEVPKLRGKALKKAKAGLEKAGLAVGRITEREDEELSGQRVLSQSPAAGERVEPGTTVDLVIVAPD